MSRTQRHRATVAAVAAVGLASLAVVLVPDGGPEARVTAVVGQRTAGAAVAVDAPGRPHGEFVYATSDGMTVTVFSQAVDGGAPRVLFAYDGWDGYPESLRDGSPPELSLSPDGASVAYLARSGLRIRNLGTGADAVVVGRTEVVVDGYRQPPRWTIGTLNATDEDPADGYSESMYGLADIAWSPDARYLSFAGSWWESVHHVVVELGTDNHWIDTGASDLAWSDSRIAVAGPFYVDPGELSVSAPFDYGHWTDLRPVIDGPDDRDYDDVAFHPGGERIAVTFGDWRPSDGGTTSVALSDTDGANFVVLDSGGEKENLVFSAGGSLLYYIEQRPEGPVLVSHDLARHEAEALAALPAGLDWFPELRVTPAGGLFMVGRAVDDEGRYEQQRYVVVAPDGQIVRNELFARNAGFAGVR